MQDDIFLSLIYSFQIYFVIFSLSYNQFGIIGIL